MAEKNARIPCPQIDGCFQTSIGLLTIGLLVALMALSFHAVFPTLPVRDVREKAEWYQQNSALICAFSTATRRPTAQFSLGRQHCTFFPGAPNPDHHWVYLQVEDVDEVYEWIRGNGVETLDAPIDQPWRMREFNLCDLNGYHLRFGAADINSGESLTVEHVPFNARVEKLKVKHAIDYDMHDSYRFSEQID